LKYIIAISNAVDYLMGFFLIGRRKIFSGANYKIDAVSSLWKQSISLIEAFRLIDSEKNDILKIE
jgi:hypothetical protein